MSEDLTRNLPSDEVGQILFLLRGVDARLSGVDARLTGLEERVDRRLMETRPIWEQVLIRLDGIDTRLNGVETRLNGIDTRLDGIDARLNGVETRLNGIDTRLDGIDARLDGIDARLDGIDARLDGLDKSIDSLGLDMRAGFKRLERQMGQLATEYIAVRTDQSDLEKRMDRLEDKLEAKPVG